MRTPVVSLSGETSEVAEVIFLCGFILLVENNCRLHMDAECLTVIHKTVCRILNYHLCASYLWNTSSIPPDEVLPVLHGPAHLSWAS